MLTDRLGMMYGIHMSNNTNILPSAPGPGTPKITADGSGLFVYNAELDLHTPTRVFAYAGAKVTARAGSTVDAYKGSTVYAYEGSTVRACEESTVHVMHESVVIQYGESAEIIRWA